MQHREELEKKITKKLEMLVGSGKQQSDLSIKVAKDWGVPMDKASDLVSMKIGLVAESEFVLFILASVLDIKVKDYYSATEIKAFSKSKYHMEKLKFPIKWDMIQVNSDQWIGRIMISDLMKLRDAQIITYNENTQRTIERVVKGDKEFYRITVDDGVVEQIADEYLEEQYISNTLTFNLPETASFRYDKDEKVLVIDELSNLDIIDGYHRYLGAARALLKDPELDFPMELRIVFFPENKARQFIWQEDQKTKMTKTDSQSFNQYDYGNTLVQFLNMNPAFAASGLIGKRGVIDAGYLGEIIDRIYFASLSDKESKEKYLQLRKTLLSDLNEVIDGNPQLLEKRWEYKDTLSAVYVISAWKKGDIAKDKAFSQFRKKIDSKEYKELNFHNDLGSSKKRTLSAIYNKIREER